MNTRNLFIVAMVTLFIASPWVCETAFAGTIVGWGSNDSGESNAPNENDFPAISVSGAHSLALGVDVDSEWTVEPFVSTGANEQWPVWSPDGSQLSYISNESGTWQVYVINSDGTGKWRVSQGSAAAGSPAWSPDSQYVLYHEGNCWPSDLYKVRLNATRDGVAERWNLTQAPAHNVRWGQFVQFSPDGNMIVAESGYGGWPRLRTITNRDADAFESDWTSIAKNYAMSLSPTWKPDGSVIAYCHFNNWQATNLGDIWTVEPDGTNDVKILDRSIANQHTYYLAWSPDGADIAFSECYSELDHPPYISPAGPHLGLVSADGTNLRWLDGAISHIAPQVYSWQADIWSPDENSIVYSRGAVGCQDIYLIDRDGSDRRLVVSSPRDDINARFSIDGTIVFQTNRDGNWDIYIASEPSIGVAIDIKPGSCPNPLNVKSEGILPVAILGSEEFDVATIDIASIRLAGVAPIRSNYEDVATPLLDKTDECECTTEGPDGYLDMTLKFTTQEIVDVLGEVNDGDVLTLTLTGLLFESLCETRIEGSDCVVIIARRGKKE